MKTKAIIVITVAFTFLCCAQGGESLGWEGMITHTNSEKALRATPTITAYKTNGAKVYLRVENHTGINIGYDGYSKDRPQMFRKDKREGKWVATSWDWCGTGMEAYVLKNKATTTFEITTLKSRVQVFTIFRNAKDPKEFSLVKLYEKDGG